MRAYETIIISEPDLGDEQRETLFERLKEIISQKGGMLVEFDIWGSRQLAYEIKKKVRGHYVRISYCGEASTVNELERFSRIDDRVMKFMTILMDDQPNIEEIKAAAEAKATGSPAAEPDAGKEPESISAENESETEDAETEITPPEEEE
jgi:small subunit ribosomal protein S6